MVFEPILFGLTGTMIKLDEVDPHNVGMVIACLIAGFVVRATAEGREGNSRELRPDKVLRGIFHSRRKIRMLSPVVQVNTCFGSIPRLTTCFAPASRSDSSSKVGKSDPTQLEQERRGVRQGRGLQRTAAGRVACPALRRRSARERGVA